MKPLSRLKGWFRRRRRRRASRKEQAALREFVYLDETSVYSLLASRLGPIAAEFTETETTSLQDEVATSLSGGLGIKGEVDSRSVAVRTRGSQVLRRSIVQTAFKELFEYEQRAMLLKPIQEQNEIPRLPRIDADSMQTLLNSNLALKAASLDRGQLFEVEVELEAEAIYRVSAVVSAILEIFKDNPEMLGFDESSGFFDVKAVDRILQRLLVGLVPVRGRFVEYVGLRIDDEDWIVHKSVLDALPSGELNHNEIHVVGVADEALFWKDIRRVLFSNSRFRVLARVAQKGLQTSWTPIKLAHVLETVAPDLARQLDEVGAGALAAMVEATRSDSVPDQRAKLMREALRIYASELARYYGQTITAGELDEAGVPTDIECGWHSTVKDRRRAFDSVADFVVKRFELEREPLVIAQHRAVALADVGIEVSGTPSPLVEVATLANNPTSSDLYLDAEFVAIYW